MNNAAMAQALRNEGDFMVGHSGQYGQQPMTMGGQQQPAPNALASLLRMGTTYNKASGGALSRGLSSIFGGGAGGLGGGVGKAAATYGPEAVKMMAGAGGAGSAGAGAAGALAGMGPWGLAAAGGLLAAKKLFDF